MLQEILSRLCRRDQTRSEAEVQADVRQFILEAPFELDEGDLVDKCVAYAKAHPYLERPDRTVRAVFGKERSHFVLYRGYFDGFHALPASVLKTYLVRFDNNKYSVGASTIGRPVEV